MILSAIKFRPYLITTVTVVQTLAVDILFMTAKPGFL